MTRRHTRLKLGKGKGTNFVKSRLRRLPQQDDVWEADFQREVDYWMGLVIRQSDHLVLAEEMLDVDPSVNSIANLLADAMYRPAADVRQHRPKTIWMREEFEWQELLPHLQELGIEVVLTDELPDWQGVADGYESPVKSLRLHLRQQQRAKQPQTEVDFPNIAGWVKVFGWIEIGLQEESGFVARLLDGGGLVYEDDRCENLADAMSSLEAAIPALFKDQGLA